MSDAPNPRPDGDEPAPAPAPRSRWRGAPVALTAAAAVAAIVAVVAGVRLLADDPDDGARAGAAPHHETRRPRFSLQIGTARNLPWLQVQALRGGRLETVDTVRRPSSAGQAGAIVEAPHDAFVVSASTAKRCETRLYRFRLTGGGHVTGLRQVGAVPGIASGLAVSPDGNRIAYTSASCAGTDPQLPDGSGILRIREAAPALSVLDTATGRRRTWTTTGTAVLGDIVWAADGRTLGYALGGVTGGSIRPVTVHALDTRAEGADLRAGRVLFRQPGGMRTVDSAVMSPDGRSGHGTASRTSPPATLMFSFEDGRTKITKAFPRRSGRTDGLAYTDGLVMVSTGDGPRYACLNGVDAFGRVTTGQFEATAQFHASCPIAWGY